MRVLAIDPGIKHLALAIVNFNGGYPALHSAFSFAQLSNIAQLEWWVNIDLVDGRKNVSRINLCAKLYTELEKLHTQIGRCTHICIEHQMSSNKNTTVIQNQLTMYFMCKHPTIPLHLVSPKHKQDYLAPLCTGVEININRLHTYSGRKKWGIQFVCQYRKLIKQTREDCLINDGRWFVDYSTWRAWDRAEKKDDLADSFLTALAFWMYYKGRPKAKTYLLLNPRNESLGS